MSSSHPSLEKLAKLLSGRMEYDELIQEFLPHLLAKCEACGALLAEIRRLQQQIGHWDELVVVLESREAPELLERLAVHPFEEQLRLVEEQEAFHAWGFCDLLLRRSREAVCGDPQQAVDLALLAVRLAAHLGDAYDPEWVIDLRARAHAHLANAHRVLGELRCAEDSFRQADALLARSQSGNARVEAEVLSFKASLRRSQRRFDEAVELLDRALSIYKDGDPEARDRHLAGRTLVERAYVEVERCAPEWAIPLLREAAPLIDRERDPRLLLCLQHNLLDCLAKTGRAEEAEALLPEVRSLCREIGGDLDLLRLRWVEGKIDFGRGRLEAAEMAFREVRSGLLDRRLGYDAALASLDLALLYAQEGRTRDLKRLAGELVPVFESREVHREALVALLMFQAACEEERMTVQLARQLSDLLQRERQPERTPFPSHS